VRREAVVRLDDPRLEPYRALRDGPRLRQQGLFVAESRHVVRRLLAPGAFRLRSVLATPRAWEGLGPAGRALAADVEALVAEPALLARVAGHQVHQGCLALAERGPGRDVGALCAALAAGPPGPVVALEALADAQNVGGVFRAARAFGARAVLLGGGGADPLSRKAIRVSTGATLELPFARCHRWPDGLGRLREGGFAVWALCADEGEPLRRVAPADRVALLLGGEDRGLSAEARARADRRVRIAMAPGCDSLNVAVAAAIALHHLHGGGASCGS
jgi:tRNA G18 (ribose-2'-O)-methylase SpoU